MSNRLKITILGILLGVAVIAYVFYSYQFQIITDVDLVQTTTTPLHQAIRDDLPLSTIKKMIDSNPKLLEENDPALLGSVSHYAIGRARHDVLEMLIEDYGLDMTSGDAGTLDITPAPNYRPYAA